MEVPISATKKVGDEIIFFGGEINDPRNKAASGQGAAHLSYQNLMVQPSPKECEIWGKQKYFGRFLSESFDEWSGIEALSSNRLSYFQICF